MSNALHLLMGILRDTSAAAGCRPSGQNAPLHLELLSTVRHSLIESCRGALVNQFTRICNTSAMCQSAGKYRRSGVAPPMAGRPHCSAKNGGEPRAMDAAIEGLVRASRGRFGMDAARCGGIPARIPGQSLGGFSSAPWFSPIHRRYQGRLMAADWDAFVVVVRAWCSCEKAAIDGNRLWVWTQLAIPCRMAESCREVCRARTVETRTGGTGCDGHAWTADDSRAGR